MSDVEDICSRFRIAPTEQRESVLKLILGIEKGPFSVHDLSGQIKAARLQVCHNTLVTTLQMLVARKVLRAFPAPKNGRKKGRPLMMYVLDPTLISSRSTLPDLQQPEAPENVKGIDFH